MAPGKRTNGRKLQKVGDAAASTAGGSQETPAGETPAAAPETVVEAAVRSAPPGEPSDVWHTPGLDDPLGGDFRPDDAAPRLPWYGPAFSMDDAEVEEADVAPGSVGSRRVRRRLDPGSSLAEPSAAPSTAEGSCKAGKKGGKTGGRPPRTTAAKGEAPRWCKALYVADEAKSGALLRASAKTGRQEDKGKIICRMCRANISFAASSYTAASRHVGTHGVTRENIEVAVAFAAKADESKEEFPLKEWKDHLEAGDGKRRVYTFMQQARHETGTQMWKQHRDAIARWVASDTMAISVVESRAFRKMCTALNGRCPAFSRKAISNRVSS